MQCSKPHPYSILRAVLEIGIPNPRCAYVGDVVDDMAAAGAAKQYLPILAIGFVGDHRNRKAARESLLREFDFGTWSKIRIGMFFSFAGASSPSSSYSLESVVLSSVFDRFSVGIKNSDNTALPLQTGSVFWGATNSGSISSEIWNQSSVNRWGARSSDLFPLGISLGATISASLTSVSFTRGWDMPIAPTASLSSSSFAGALGLEIEIISGSTLGQRVAIRVAKEDVTSNGLGTGDTSIATLVPKVSNFTFDTISNVLTFNAVSGSTPIPAPDALFIRNPFFNNQLRIHSVAIVQIS
jgi:hypothetical protein